MLLRIVRNVFLWLDVWRPEPNFYVEPGLYSLIRINSGMSQETGKNGICTLLADDRPHEWNMKLLQKVSRAARPEHVLLRFTAYLSSAMWEF